MTASLLDVLYCKLIYSLVIPIHLHSVGYLISQRPHDFLRSSKWQTQQAIVVTRYGKRQEEYRIEDVDRLTFLRLITSLLRK